MRGGSCRYLHPVRSNAESDIDSARMNESLAIIGASARAAASCTRRAGFVPVAADLFGDRDLRAIADWVGISDYPRGVLEAARRLPPAPWIYTGGLENCHDLVDRLAVARPLLGNGGKVLRRVRDPFRLAQCLREAGLSSPAVARDPPPFPTRHGWLQKPLASCGGRGILRCDTISERGKSDEPSGQTFFQEFVAGKSYSAAFVTARGMARLLGVTRQLVGKRWTGAKGFSYCGSLGPVFVDAVITATLQRIGSCLAETFGLVGLIGVDLVMTKHRVYVIEINPRFPSSVEILEQAFAGNRSLMREHVDACRAGALPPESIPTLHPCWGKAVLFATRRVRIGDNLARFIEHTNRNQTWPPLADIPCDGTVIDVGHPILTVRTEALTMRDARRNLQRLAIAVRSVLDTDQ